MLDETRKVWLATRGTMKAGRFLRWHNARQLKARIAAHCARGGKVQISTATRSVIYPNAEWFIAVPAGLHVMRGARWDCLTGHDGKPLVSIRLI